MESSTPTRVLVVANRTAATPALLDAVRERAGRGQCRFTLLVPHTLHRPAPAGGSRGSGPVRGRGDAGARAAADGEGRRRPRRGDHRRSRTAAAIHDAVNIHGFDEIILSTLPKRVSRWLKLDLPSKLSGLGLPVTTVTASSREEPHRSLNGFPRSSTGCRF